MIISDQIIAQCAIAFSAHSEDCNKFLKAVAAAFFDPDLFAGPNMNADAIVTELRASASWASLATSHRDAIAAAKDNQFVIAGMLSAELGAAHGHLAVVVADDGQLSGSVLVPTCYAGSLSPSARVQRRRVSETFGAVVARESRISYFAQPPSTVPAAAAVSRLVDHLRGLALPVATVAASAAEEGRRGTTHARKRRRKK